ncbi:MAG: lipoyl(octanoyl) transferase LipB [Chlorobi bacterium]|nr:lipoyl(octanoyl) transferase LipB [Chlorobiota bacterium]
MTIFEQLLIVQCGLTRYRDAWELQKRIWNARHDGVIPDVLLLTEHQHVYTLGRNTDTNHLIASSDRLKRQEIEVIETDRGGDITYHGPGQLIVYPILDLRRHGQDLHRYLRMLEESIILMAGKFGIAAEHDPQYTGVWVGEHKLASIGIKVSRWISMHGAAINICNDLSYFDGIIPCGIFHRDMTSVSKEVGREITIAEAGDILVTEFCSVFSYKPEAISYEDLLRITAREKETT